MGGRPGGRFPRLFLFLIVTYLAVLVLPLVTGAAVQRRTEDLLRAEVLSVSRGILRQLKITLDGELRSLSRKTMQIGESPGIRAIRSRLRIGAVPDPYDVREAGSFLASAIYTDPLVRRCFLYFRDADYVVSDGFSSGRRHFFELESGAAGLGLPGWTDLLDREHGGTLASLSDGDLYYMESPIGGAVRDRDVTVCFILDKSRVRDLIASSDGLSGGSLFVLDRDGGILVSREHGVRGPPALPGSSGEAAGTGTADAVSIRELSADGRLEYVLALPKTVLLGKVDYVRRYALLLMAATVFLGLSSGLLFAWMQYRPVEKLLRFASRDGTEPEAAGNAYEAIRRALASAFDNESRYRDLSARRLSELRADFLYRMLRSLDMDEAARAEGLLRHGISFPYGSFTILLAVLEDETVDRMEEAGFASPEPLDLGPGLQIRVFQPSDLLVVLANFDGARRTVRSVAEALRGLLGDRSGGRVTLAAGGVKDSVHALPRAYLEAAQALESRDRVGPGGLLDYAEIDPRRTLFTWSLDDGERLMNLVRAGDAPRAVAVVEAILDPSIGWERMTAERRMLLKYNLVGAFARLVGEDGAEAGTELTGILTCESLGDLRSLAVRIAGTLCGRRRRADGAERRRDLVERIRGRVAESYGDPNLNIARLGDDLGLTPYYISRIFRETHGTSLLDYINRARVERAKPLLTESGESVGRIARQVGYERVAAFIRAFKGVEGITPGAYRDSRKSRDVPEKRTM